MERGVIEIDGIRALREESPGSPEELARIMKDACDAGCAMSAVGAGTKLHLGNQPGVPCLAVHTRGLHGIIEYEPDNLTISALAGTTLAEIQQILRASNQFLPLDPPFSDRATLGGIVAANSSGPIRFRYGTVRDMLIGIRIVHADGTCTKAGGKLVKNVSGYDMCKLYAGSLGTLGIFSELTFKVHPKPEAVATVKLGYASLGAVLNAAQTFIGADLTPCAMEALNGPAFEELTGNRPDAPWVMLVRFGETDTAVRWQVDRLREIAPGGGGTPLNTLGTQESEVFWLKAAGAREGADGDHHLLVKCSVMYRSVPETAAFLAEMGERMQACAFLYCHAGNHVIYARYQWPDGDCGTGALQREISALRERCSAAGGHVVVERVRAEAKRGMDVWGYQSPAVELMRRIKLQLDPKGLLNPGRFVGGI